MIINGEEFPDMYVLDTNIWIEYLKGNQKIISKIQEVGLENCFLIDYVFYELQAWALSSENEDECCQKLSELWNGDVAKMEDKHIKENVQFYGIEKSRLLKENKQMDMLSLMLALIAHPYETMVTDKVDEFKKFGNDLKIENWLE